MDISDSDNKASQFWRDGLEDIENLTDPDLSLFRGLEKEPKVVIEKFDIQPFLLNTLSQDRNSPTNENLMILPQIASDCFVKLVNDDLEQLKEEVLKNSRMNKIRPNGSMNMAFLSCKICEKAYSSDMKLQKHLENKHMLVSRAGVARKAQKRVSFSDRVVVHEIKEYHKCRKCTKIFEEYKSLKIHTKKEHRERKCYICHYCTKDFVDRMFFKEHIKLHCDVCGLLLPNRHSHLRHKRDTCRIVKKYPCKTCHISVFRYMDLKDHSYEHFEDLFICDICKEQHSSKCAVAHHILFLHSKRRPVELYTNLNLGNERLYLCNFCEYSSIDKHALETHVSSLADLNNRKRTGYKDYYFCDQCLRKFDTETDMLKHKWSHFLNTSAHSQVQDGRVRVHSSVKVQEESCQKLQGQRYLKLQEPSPELDQKDSCKTALENSCLVDEGLKIFKMNEKLPILMQPKIVLERVDYVKKKKSIELVNNHTEQSETSNTEKIDRLDDLETEGFEIGVTVKKAIVHPKTKKTLISRFQCKICHKFYSNNYCLNRHIFTQHTGYSNLTCNVCEESFVWPSLLRSHKCIRMNIPEMPFDDARPEIRIQNCGFNDLMNITGSEDCMPSVDFDIPAPVVRLDYQSHGNRSNVSGGNGVPVRNTYKIVMQEVPIEF